jgi:hypothetical protein
MNRCEAMRQLLEDLIRVLQEQMRLLERTVERIEQVTGHLGVAREYGIIASELAALAVRARHLAEQTTWEPV